MIPGNAKMMDHFYVEKPCKVFIPSMSGKNELRALAPALALVFVAMLIVMFLYELAKQLLHPEISIWESHAVTIIFTSVMAVIIVSFPLRSFYREKQKSASELCLRIDAEENLRQSEIQYRSFVESVEDSIYTVDRDCRYLLINARHLARRGLPPGTYAGKHYADFHSAEEARVFSNQVNRVLDTRSPVQDEYEQSGKFFLRKLNPVIDPEINEVIAVTVISSDITDRKLSEKYLETINRKLNLMTDITRHDLRNQLLVLSSYLALAQEQSAEDTTKRYLLKSEQAVDTIHAQINFARDYQKIGVDRPQWQMVTAIIQKARMPLKLPWLTIDIPLDAEIFADPLLEKVFYNLLENALRHAGPEPEIRFSVIDEPGRLLIICEDNGPGVPDVNKEKIFERGIGKNTGLGLFLSREILSITGISIHEEGTFGEGSRFVIGVPSGMYRIRNSG